MIFHKRSVENKDRTKISGIKYKNAISQNDGRKRIQVNLPDLDWVLANLPSGRPKIFPIEKMCDEYHAPQYLNFSASLLDADNGSLEKDAADQLLCSHFGSAKLTYFSKKERKYTVIIYGINPSS